MNLDELQSVQSRERQTDSLQQLRESFYRDAGEFIEQLRRERDRAAEQAEDQWNAPEVSRLNDDIDTAEGTVEAIYERRVGKIVKMASLAAADMATEDDGLTAEERSLFKTLVSAIENNRAQVDALLDGMDPASVTDATSTAESPADTVPSGESQTGTASADPDATGGRSGPAGASGRERTPPEEPPADDPGDEPQAAPNDRVDAADLMGGGGSSDLPADEGTSPDVRAGDSHGGEPTSGSQQPEPGGEPTPGSQQPEPGGQPTGSPPPGPGDSSGDSGGSAGVDRETVRITKDVGEIFGVDERQYDLTTEDVVTLPADNVEPLVESDAAERLE